MSPTQIPNQAAAASQISGAAVSLRMRLWVGGMVVMLSTLVLLGWSLQALFTQHITAQLYAQLELHLHQLSAAIEKKSDGSIFVRPLHSSPQWEEPFSGLYWQVDRQSTAASYEPLMRSRSLWDQVLQVPVVGATSDSSAFSHSAATSLGVWHIQWPDDQGRQLIGAVRIAKLPGAQTSLRLVVAAEQAQIAAPLSAFRSMLWLALGLFAAGLIAASALQLHLALKPLHLLRKGLEAVRAGQATYLQGQYPQELQPLVNEFNHVLTENADMVQRARTHAGNLAHAVHTPLAILANAAHAAGEQEAWAKLVQEQVATARQQVDYHLARARAAAAVRATGVSTPMLEPVQALLRTMERLHSARNLHWLLVPFPQDWAFKGEAQNLYEMLGNVLDNAGKWANSRVQLQVQLSSDAKSWQVIVDDDGPGIPEAARQRMLQRGMRLDEQKPGSGLGLDIVSGLVDSYGGQIQLLTSPWSGLRVVIQLPKS